MRTQDIAKIGLMLPSMKRKADKAYSEYAEYRKTIKCFNRSKKVQALRDRYFLYNRCYCFAYNYLLKITETNKNYNI